MAAGAREAGARVADDEGAAARPGAAVSVGEGKGVAGEFVEVTAPAAFVSMPDSRQPANRSTSPNNNHHSQSNKQG